jgi:tRNA pseudouridine38-40 synthase
MAQESSRRIVLLLEYDGSSYAGSQYQPNARTIQSALETAIEKTTGDWTRAAFAGRTDAGVHARGQVASFLTESRLDAGTLQRALNAWLPPDIVVLAATETAANHDVRRHARARHYRYLIENRAARPTLERGGVWHVSRPLDAAAMEQAAGLLQGTRDFRAFAGPLESEGASTVRDLHCFSVQRRGTRLTCDLVANAFLPHQVRRMVGALVEVGKGKMRPDEYEALLEGPLSSAGPAAPAQGLYLMRVQYEPPLFDEQVAVRHPV